MSKKKIIFSLFFAVLLMFVTVMIYFGFESERQSKKGSEPHLTISNYLHYYGAGICTAVIRMVLGGVPAEKIRFNMPDEFAALDDPKYGVFHPKGGGVQYQYPRAEYMEHGKKTRWFHNAEFMVAGVGYKEKIMPEILAFLVGLNKDYCEGVNQQHEIEGIPRLNSDQSQYYTKSMVDDGKTDYQFPVEPRELDNPALKGKYEGCFQSYDGQNYVGFTILLEQ